MATITLTVTHPSLTLNKTFTVTDAELVRIVTACKSFYTPPGQSTINNQQALNKVADELWGRLRNITRDYELSQAVAALVVDPITPT